MAPASDDDTRSLSGPRRALLILGAVAVLVVAFVIARGGDDEPADRIASPAATTQAPQTTEPAPVPTTTEPEPEPAPEPEIRERTVRVEGGRPRGGARTLTFVKGEPIRLRIVSDTADEVHVHGYDLSKDVRAGGSVRFRFKATIEGRFEIELENAGTLLATLEVTPS